MRALHRRRSSSNVTTPAGPQANRGSFFGSMADVDIESCNASSSDARVSLASARSSRGKQELPGPPLLQRTPSQLQLEQARKEFDARESAYFEKARNDAKASLSACFEDLIGFLEMHNISGAYALGLSANGVENLGDLLIMDDARLNQIIQRCEIDAMDEILLLEALRKARGR